MALALKPLSERLGIYTKVTKVTIPSSGYVNEPFQFYIEGHVESSVPGDWPNFALGIIYDDGPADSVKINESSFRKGTGLAVYTQTKSVCTTIYMNGTITAPSEGTYRFAIVTGTMKNSTFYIDDKVEATVSITSKPTIPTIPTPTGLPWWVWAAVAGIAVVGIGIGIAMYMEERRLEMLLLARR